MSRKCLLKNTKMEYLLIVLVPVILYGIFYLTKKRNEKNRIEKVIQSPLSEISDEEKIQNRKNIQFIRDLIYGNYLYVSKKKKNKSIRAFEKWKQKEKFLFEIADSKKIRLRNKYINNEISENLFLQHEIVSVSPCKETHGRPNGWQLFLKNGFTEPFPSLHDMDDWAIANKITDIFILNGFEPEDSKNFVFHIKKHYVNHEMTFAIIQFDLYKVPQ